MNRVVVARHAMATRFEVALFGEDPVSLRAAGEEALDEVERLDRQLSRFRRDSVISRLNGAAGQGEVRMDRTLFRLIERMKDLSRESGGAFDPTVAPLIQCWGFGGSRRSVPSDDAIDRARELVGIDGVETAAEASSVRLTRAGMMLDLGGIGKGYALDAAADVLIDNGIERALLHGGTSTVRALGAPPDETGWRVAIELPSDFASSRTETTGEADGVFAAAVVDLRDESLSVSSSFGKYFVDNGKILGHVLDPRTGRPGVGALLAAVIVESATDADALSTALMISGAAGAEALAGGRPRLKSLVIGAARDAKGIWPVTGRGIEARAEFWEKAKQ